MGDLGHIAERGHIIIPALPLPSHLLSTTAPLARPLSSSPVAVDVCLGQPPPLWSPPGIPTPAVRSASAPPSVTLGGMLSGPPSGTPPVPWALQWGGLQWHRTPSSSQGTYLSGPLGPVSSVSPAGGWPLSLVLPLLGPERGPARKFFVAPPPPGRRSLQFQRWLAARIPTPVGVTSAVLHKRTVVACELPLLGSSLTLPIPESSPPTICPPPLCLQQNPKFTGSHDVTLHYFIILSQFCAKS